MNYYSMWRATKRDCVRERQKIKRTRRREILCVNIQCFSMRESFLLYYYLYYIFSRFIRSRGRLERGRVRLNRCIASGACVCVQKKIFFIANGIRSHFFSLSHCQIFERLFFFTPIDIRRKIGAFSRLHRYS